MKFGGFISYLVRHACLTTHVNFLESDYDQTGLIGWYTSAN
jgi:hypothetical protein